jgi:hypothetical protein
VREGDRAKTAARTGDARDRLREVEIHVLGGRGAAAVAGKEDEPVIEPGQLEDVEDAVERAAVGPRQRGDQAVAPLGDEARPIRHLSKVEMNL